LCAGGGAFHALPMDVVRLAFSMHGGARLYGVMCVARYCSHRVSVILTSNDLDNVGYIGEEVSVKAGFARNFLIPQRKAVYATEDNRDTYKVEYLVRIATTLALAVAAALLT